MKKRDYWLWHFFSFLVLLALMNSTAIAESNIEEEINNKLAGKGLQYDPWLISSYNDLCHVRDGVDQGCCFENRYFKVAKDIIFPAGAKWNPIGDVRKGYGFRAEVKRLLPEWKTAEMDWK